MSLLRALLGALAAGVLPGYPWAVLVRRCDGLTERLAYSAAISLASVPAVALLLTRLLGTGVTLQVALASVAAVAGSGALARRLWGVGDETGPVLPRPAAVSDGRALALALLGLGLALASALGMPTPSWLLITILASFAIAGLLACRAAAPEGAAGGASAAGGAREPGPGVSTTLRAPALALVLALTALLAYSGVVGHDWPYLRGEDQFSHAVMTEQMLAHGSYGSYLVYPPGFSTLSAIICRLTGLAPLALFAVLTPALLLLAAAGSYALATRLWGWEHGLSAAALSGLVLVGPYASFGGGLYPDLVCAFFLMAIVVAALITLYQSPSARAGLLVAVVGASVVLYHSVASLYLVLLLVAVAISGLPYLLLRRGTQERALARAITVTFTALGALAAAYGWCIYHLGDFFGPGATTRATIDLDVGSQQVLKASDLLAWVGPPIIWLGVLGFAALAASVRRLAHPARVLTVLTVLLWCVTMYLGSRTTIDGFPQRFERDVGAPLTVLAAFGIGMIFRSLMRLRAGKRPAAMLAAAAVATAVTGAAVQFASNLRSDAAPSREVLTRPEAKAGAWLRRHNTGGTIISTPDLRRGVTNRAVLAMGGYTGLQSYELPRIDHPRSLPTAGMGPVLDSRLVLLDPDTCRAISIIARDDVRFIFLYWPGTQANLGGFSADPAEYRLVFENSQILIYAPQRTPAQFSSPANCVR